MKFATLNLILLPLVFVAPGWLLALGLRVDTYRGNAWRQIFHAFVLSIVANSFLITLLLAFDHFSPQLILDLNGIAGICALVITAIRAPALNANFNHRTLIAAALILIAFCLLSACFSFSVLRLFLWSWPRRAGFGLLSWLEIG